MNERIYLSSPHMSEQGYEEQYVKEAFETNWVAPLGPNVTNFEIYIERLDEMIERKERALYKPFL